MGSSSSTNTFILFLFSVVLLYCHIRSNKTNGEKLLNEEDNTLKGLFNEVFAINFLQKKSRKSPKSNTDDSKKSVYYRRKDDSGCESDVSSNNSSDDTPLGLPRNKRRKKYTKNKGCDIAAIR